MAGKRRERRLGAGARGLVEGNRPTADRREPHVPVLSPHLPGSGRPGLLRRRGADDAIARIPPARAPGPPPATALYGIRDYGAAVMYDKGKILYVGGGRTTNTAEIIDLNGRRRRGSGPAPWRSRGGTSTPRCCPRAKSSSTGGVSGTAFNDVTTTAVHAAEMWNPTTGTWTTLASNAINRGYHSTSILLPGRARAAHRQRRRRRRAERAERGVVLAALSLQGAPALHHRRRRRSSATAPHSPSRRRRRTTSPRSASSGSAPPPTRST